MQQKEAPKVLENPNLRDEVNSLSGNALFRKKDFKREEVLNEIFAKRYIMEVYAMRKRVVRSAFNWGWHVGTCKSKKELEKEEEEKALLWSELKQ